MKTCECGSNIKSRWVYDAKGIPVFKACIKCEEEQKRGYRPEIFIDPFYECNEVIEPDEYEY